MIGINTWGQEGALMRSHLYKWSVRVPGKMWVMQAMGRTVASFSRASLWHGVVEQQ